MSTHRDDRLPNEPAEARAAAALDAPIACLAPPDAEGRPVRLVRPCGLGAFRDGLDPASRSFIETLGFGAEPGALVPLPGPDGRCAGVVCGIGDEAGPDATGRLATLLPPGTWRFEEADLGAASLSPADALLGFCLGADRVRPARPAGDAPTPSAPTLLVPPKGTAKAEATARAIRFGRALVNQPANRLGPSELADELVTLARRFGARARRVESDALRQHYPAVAAVGAGSDRPPVVAVLEWRGSAASDTSPLVSLVGKGVCFDTGGYDLKTSAGMLRMKKDMGGAAVVLATAMLLMARDAPIRLEVRIGCVENSVSGRAMRPSDVIATRKGLSVEVNNTDAEGRLVLADLLAEAGEAEPDLLLDVATLTGAARVALGPDLPALFTDDDALAAVLVRHGMETNDPVWRLPLWRPYSAWLASGPADLANVSAKPMAGAVTAALFLHRFVPDTVRWAHLDAYCWNDATAPGRPEGGEVPLVRLFNAAVIELCETGTKDGSNR